MLGVGVFFLKNLKQTWFYFALLGTCLFQQPFNLNQSDDDTMYLQTSNANSGSLLGIHEEVTDSQIDNELVLAICQAGFGM